MRHLLPLCALALATAPGCAFFAQSHIPYTPMLNRGGQVDVSVRTGVTYPGGVPVAVNAAVAPVDGLEILANADINVGTSNSHYGGGLAIGTFVPTDVFRLEFIAGANAGYGTGLASELTSGSVAVNYDVTGPYVTPFGQLMLGFETRSFLMAAGARVQGFFAQTTAVSTTAATIVDGYERLYVDPVVTFQFPIDFVRIEVTTGFPIFVSGDIGPTPRAVDSALQWYLAAGVGFQWDAFGEPEPEPEPEYVVPPPAPAPPPAVVPPPAAPPTYEGTAIITPVAEPAPAPAPSDPAPVSPAPQ